MRETCSRNSYPVSMGRPTTPSSCIGGYFLDRVPGGIADAWGRWRRHNPGLWATGGQSGLGMWSHKGPLFGFVFFPRPSAFFPGCLLRCPQFRLFFGPNYHTRKKQWRTPGETGVPVNAKLTRVVKQGCRDLNAGGPAVGAPPPVPAASGPTRHPLRINLSFHALPASLRQ